MTEEMKNASEQDQPQTEADAVGAETKSDEATEAVSEEAVSEETAVDEVAEEAASEETAVAEEHKLPEDKITVEDAGTLKKKVTVQVDRRKIDAKFNEMFGELGRTAQVPGFRIGHAPRRLIEKRFGKEVADDVRNAILGEAIGKALEDAEFKPLGEPDIKLDEIELPDSGDLTFDFEMEVAPEFDLPDYKGIEITRPVIEITEERIEEALTAHRRRLGRLKPIDAAAQADDLVVADVTIAGDGIDHRESNLELRVAPAQVEGIILEDLPEILSGKKTGDSPSVKATIPAAHPNEEWREKEVTVTFDIQEVKRLELPELNEDFARREGFDSLDELRETMGDNLRARVSIEQRRAMRSQVRNFLMENTDFDLPEGLAQRHAERLLTRRYIDLMNRGVPRDRIDQNLQELRAAASEQAVTELKLSFILADLAEAEGIEVDDGEINARIAQIAAQYNRRPERLRQEMKNDGSLEHLATAIVEEKAIEKVLESANIVDTDKSE